MIEALLKASNVAHIDRQTLFDISSAFYQLKMSHPFKRLGRNYTFHNIIKELQGKLHRLAETHKNSQHIRFRLSWERKAQLIAIRKDLKECTEDMKFSELYFKDYKIAG